MHYMVALFPDAADVEGKRVLIKIDGGPDRLDVQSLAELWAGNSKPSVPVSRGTKYNTDNTGDRTNL